MGHDFVQVATDLTESIKGLQKGAPNAMRAYAGFGREVYGDGALDAKTKELLALVIAVAIRCDGCVAFHARGAAERGATREEVVEAMWVATHMGGGPSLVYGAEGLRAFDQFAAAKNGKS